MAYFCNINFLGNLTKDPVIRQTKNGMSVCDLNVASNRVTKNKQGEQEKEVCFIDVTAFGPQAEFCNKFMHTGDEVLLKGRLKQETWQDKAGNKRSKHCIIAENVISMTRRPATSSTEGAPASTTPQAAATHVQSDEMMEDLPF